MTDAGAAHGGYGRRGRPGRLKGALGSHERPASALAFRLVLAWFGAAVMLTATVLAVVWAHHTLLAVVFGAGFLGTCLNVYWVRQRLRHER
ncbi:hypothetical protein O4J56_26960 [Nocardiopsis sp. RSe5-2]|uniref:DUF2530 domain-containing protein n=1 Tax=Nocardiopsis endophytica TaxID=3018445 RepID=A0ABT4UDC3_9ACTN|nr:hypothetical protein [Nocardiopsis endophytica]MDA2814317.1 hypothetical protein [Nocardiopsis endophytica]